MAVFALIVLVLAIIIGTKKKINIGVMGLVGACILGIIGKIPLRNLVAGFNTTLFLRLLAIQLLVCSAQTNGTMETLAKKLVSLGGRKNVKFIPIIIYLAFMVCGLAGVDIVFLGTPFIIALAFQMAVNPIKVLFALILAFQGSGISPLATSGINLLSVAEKSGITSNPWSPAVVTAIASFILFIFAYFLFGWHKEENRVLEGIDDTKLTLDHIVTLLGFVAYVVLTLGFKLDTLVAPTLIAFVLMFLGVAEPKKVISSIPWSVLLMIGGMTMLTGAVNTLGGVKLLSDIITKVTIPFIQVPLMLVVAGLMSFFASGNGVVIPTLVPIIPNMSASTTALLAAVYMGAASSGISPFSTIGGHIMSCYDSIYKPSEEERTKTFNQLLLVAIASIVINAVLALVGVYNINIFG